MDLSIRDIELAADRLKSVLHHTELERSATFSAMSGAEIYLKSENRQKTGSFKIRGASNKIASLAEKGEVTSVVASSAGNHAQGVALAANKFGIPATIIMPKIAPIAKVQATESYGAKVILEGDCYDDAYAKACEVCESEGATFIHPYNDLEVIAGQGTLGLEVLKDLPTTDVILVPAGGGGLLAGIAACIKQVNPRVQVIGVQSEGADAICRSFKEKKLVTTDTVSTIADGIAVKKPGDISFELISKYVDDMVTVTDLEISDAILLLMERNKSVVEPAGATSLAAALSGKLDIKGKKVVCILSGGNIDVSFVRDIIEKGMLARHRTLKFIVTLLDMPGALTTMLKTVTDCDANIVSIFHDRQILGPNQTDVHLTCEVGGQEHGLAVIKGLRDRGYTVVVEHS